MNKILKRISLVALCFLLIGTGFTICGLLLDGTLAFSYTLGQPVNTKNNREYNMVTKEIEPVHSVQVDTDYFDIRVIPGKNFSVTYPEGEDFDSSYTVENDKLALTVQEKGKSGVHVIGFWGIMPSFSDYDNTQDDTVVVTIPEDKSLKEIAIYNSDGDCLIEGQTADNYILDLSYGDLEVTDCTGKNVELKSGDGDLSMTSGGFDSFTGKLSYGDCQIVDSIIGTGDFTLSDGEMSLDNSSVSKLTAELSYGDLDVNHTKIDQVDVSLSDGDFTARFEEAEEEFSTSLGTDDGEITINGKELGTHYTASRSVPKTLNVESSYGDIDIEFGK